GEGGGQLYEPVPKVSDGPKAIARSFPKRQRNETRFDSFKHFAFETALRLFALRLTNSRITAGKNTAVSGRRAPITASGGRPQCAQLLLCPSRRCARRS